jgi:aminobenzoyl-glutamate transport protein
MAAEKKPEGQGLVYRFLDFVEKAGNMLPHPATLFALMALAVIVLSAVLAALDYVAEHPTTGESIVAVSLLNGDGLRRIVTTMVRNFTGFVPLGAVLVAMLGVGVAEGSGLISAGLRASVLSAPKRLVTLVVVFSGVLSNAASEAGYVILIPLAAVIFIGMGRHPLVGLAAAFAGVSGGYSANLVLGYVDPLLSGITEEVAVIIDPSYTVNPAANYYFMVASTFLVTILGTWVTEKIVEPRFRGETPEGERPSVEALKPEEKRGLKLAGATTLAIAVLLILVTIIFVFFLIPGIVYGVATRSIRSDGDVIKLMGKQISTLGAYIVLVFFAAQFVAYFAWTNIGLITAIQGAGFLQSIGLTGIPLILSFVFVAALMNLFMGSASAKWAVMAPVFVPMFMLLGYSPELTQVAYRIGDSTTNLITPMMSYFALIVAFAQKYKRDTGIGTIVALMLPYTITFLIGWTLFLLAWMLLGIPVGPGAPLYLPTP